MTWESEGRTAWGRFAAHNHALPGRPATPPPWLRRIQPPTPPVPDEEPETPGGLIRAVSYKGVDERGVEWKASPLSRPLEVKDGMVVAIFSVTGIVDNVADRVLPGAYAQTLATRTPKVIRGHDWARFVGRVDPITELMPGDSRLPATTADGAGWPKEAGGLVGRVIYNQGTTLGRDAWEDAKFLGSEMEWSIGYKALRAKRDRAGIREIAVLDLFEVCDVLWGAMSLARNLQIGQENVGAA